MPVEIALLDGTKLRTEDPALEEDEILKALDSAKVSAAFAAIKTGNGTFQVNPAHVVYVRTV